MTSENIIFGYHKELFLLITYQGFQVNQKLFDSA